MAYTGVPGLVAGPILLLAFLVPYGPSALIVGPVISAVGTVLVVKGANTLRREDPTPQETVETLKEDKEWLKNQTKR